MRNIFKPKLLILFTLFYFQNFYGQSGSVNPNSNVYIPNFTPPSPEAFNFTKVAEIPVNESSGNATVTIPLYTYQAGKINVPISITHSGGAVRVDEENNWTGINWQLSAGGLITRTINDQPDETMAAVGRFHPESPTQQLLHTIATGGTAVDSEVDVFNYNFNGKSGSFYFDTNFIARQIKYDNELKIEMSGNPIVNGITRFNVRTIKITTTDGTIYSFGGVNASEATKISLGTPGQFNSFGQTSFYLFKIETILGDIVNFNYSSYNYEVSRIISYNQELTRDETVEGISNCSPQVNRTPILSIAKPYYMETTGYLKLTSITSNVNASRVDFESTTNPYEYVKGFRLDNIKVYGHFNTPIKNIKFNYDCPNVDTRANIPTYLTAASYKRFFLTSIVVKPLSETNEEKYSFEYNSYELLPRRFSYSQDYAGFFNGQLSNRCYVPNIPTFINNYTNTSLPLANRDVSYSHALYGSLKKVTYPTKGYIEFEYETGYTQRDALTTLTSNIINYAKSGIRIKSITRYDGYSRNRPKVRYYYNMAAKISSLPDSEVQVRFPRFNGFRRIVASCYDSSYCYPYTLKKSVIYSKPQNSIYMSDCNRNSYSYVTVSYGGDNFENGGKQSYYFVQADLPMSPVTGDAEYAPESKSSNNSLKNGALLNEVLFNSGVTFNQSTNEIITGKVKEVTNTYETELPEKSSKITNWSANKFCEAPTCIIGNYATYTDNYYIGMYYIFSWWHVLKSTATKEYFSTGIVETLQSYDYDGDTKLAGLPSSITTNTGIENIKTKYYYPPFSAMSTQPNNALMNQKYIIGVPLSTETYRNNIKVFEQRTQFKSNLLPEFIYAAKFPNSIPIVNTTVGNLEKKLTYNSYDSKGNVTQYTPENGTPVSLIWGYNQTQLIAKLENVLYATIPVATISDLQLKSNADIDASTEQTLIDALNLLRTTFPQSMISTYTHNPLVGVSTITDLKGDQITYSYDAFGRLQSVKDKDGNKLSENQYNYKQ